MTESLSCRPSVGEGDSRYEVLAFRYLIEYGRFFPNPRYLESGFPSPSADSLLITDQWEKAYKWVHLHTVEQAFKDLRLRDDQFRIIEMQVVLEPVAELTLPLPAPEPTRDNLRGFEV